VIERSDLPLERVIFFSDAVMAIAITLLAIDLHLPDVGDVTNGQLLNLLAGLVPRYSAFVLSFAVIGVYWFAHHRMFRFIVRWTGGLVLINTVFLFFVVQLPFLTGVLGAHGELAAAAALYALGLTGIGFTSAGLWAYALRRNLLSADADPRFVRLTLARQVVVPVVFLLSVPVAFISPLLAELTWTLVALATVVVARQLGGGNPRPVVDSPHAQ
jgi:uncharacterized membrane protein